MPVICLMGTTATGKTDAAASLVDAFGGEIVSVDSSLVYRGMDVGTAKPDADFLRRYPHALVDVREPNDTYSVADFYNDAKHCIDDICQRGRLPVLAGGTHFYFSSLENGLSDLPQADPNLRQEISAEALLSGWPRQHERLAALDKKSSERIDPNDAQRIQRALEIVLTGGKPVAAYDQARKPPLRNPIIKIALAFSDRAELHKRIETRFDLMLNNGLEDEVRALLENGTDPTAPSMRMIGYRQMLMHLERDLSFEEMRAQGIAATRQLAKRQLTWLRNQSNVVWWVDFGLKQRRFDQLIDFINICIK